MVGSPTHPQQDQGTHVSRSPHRPTGRTATRATDGEEGRSDVESSTPNLRNDRVRDHHGTDDRDDPAGDGARIAAGSIAGGDHGFDTPIVTPAGQAA